MHAIPAIITQYTNRYDLSQVIRMQRGTCGKHETYK